jgi:hypothetical protein
MRRAVVLALASLLLAGCAAARAATVGGGGGAGPGGCVDGAAAFEYIGETSFAALGLGGQMGGPDVDRIGSAWVGNMEGMPADGMNSAPVVCIEYPDGGITAVGVEPGWRPPVALEAPVEEGGMSVPTPILLVGGAAIVIIGFSVVAFRREAIG